MTDKKENRVRLGQNPFIEKSTHTEIRKRINEKGISLGKVIDEAISETTKSNPTQKTHEENNKS